MADVVPVGVVPSYYEDDMRRYDCPITALLREVLQNTADAVDRMDAVLAADSDDSAWQAYRGELRIVIGLVREAKEYDDEEVASPGDIEITFTDNGIGMAKDVMETLLVSVGGSDKQGRAVVEAAQSERGGFGAAKNLLFFAQRYYRVASRHAFDNAEDEWYTMQGSRNIHDAEAEEIEADGHGTEVTIVLNPELRTGNFECADFICRRLDPLTPRNLAEIFEYELKRSTLPQLSFIIEVDGEEISVDAEQPHGEEHARHRNDEWILYKHAKEGRKSQITVQVQGVHMFTEPLVTLRSEYSLTLDIQSNSKEHLNQHRDAMKTGSLSEVLRTLRNLDQSRGKTLNFQADDDVTMRSWANRVAQLIAEAERNRQMDPTTWAAIQAEAEQLQQTGATEEQSRQMQAVLAALEDRTWEAATAALTNLNFGFQMLITYGRRKTPASWLDPDHLPATHRILLRTVRMVLDTIFGCVGGKYLTPFDIGVVFTPDEQEAKDHDVEKQTDHLAECRTEDGMAPCIFINPEFDSTADRQTRDVALEMDEDSAAKNIYYLWGLMCHEAAHMFSDPDEPYSHGEEFCAERDRLQWATTELVDSMIDQHKEIIEAENERGDEEDDGLYHFKCSDCGKYRRIPSRVIRDSLRANDPDTELSCGDIFWDLDAADHDINEDEGLREAVGVSSEASAEGSDAASSGAVSEGEEGSSGGSGGSVVTDESGDDSRSYSSY